MVNLENDADKDLTPVIRLQNVIEIDISLKRSPTAVRYHRTFPLTSTFYASSLIPPPKVQATLAFTFISEISGGE